jgi:hypothetical protein
MRQASAEAKGKGARIATVETITAEVKGFRR